MFGKVHPRFLTPSVSTLTFGAVSIVLYVIMNNVANPTGVIADAVTALGMMIAFYYGLTGFACTWYYRHTLRGSQRNLWMRGILPSLGGVDPLLRAHLEPARRLARPRHHRRRELHRLADAVRAALAHRWGVPARRGHHMVGLVLMIIWRIVAPPFFRGETLNRDTPTLVPDDGELAPSPPPAG